MPPHYHYHHVGPLSPIPYSAIVDSACAKYYITVNTLVINKQSTTSNTLYLSYQGLPD